MMLKKLAFYLQADKLIKEAKSQRDADPDAANVKLQRAIGLLKEIDKEVTLLRASVQGSSRALRWV